MKKLAVAVVGFGLSAPALFAATNITGVIEEVNTYFNSAVAIGIAVLLFVLGRKIIRKAM